MVKNKILDNRQTCREKLPIFFGSNDNFYHGVRESVANARDVLKNQKNGLIEVILEEDCKTITIRDNGYGLPMEQYTDGVPNYEVYLTILFAGSKMDAGSTDGGTNGCGNTVTNYTSEYFKAVSYRNGKTYFIEFENGGILKTPFTIMDNPTGKTGTEITFRLDPEVYTETTFSPKIIEEICEKACVSSNNITCIFKHKDYEKVFHYENLQEYLEKYLANPIFDVDNLVIGSKNYITDVNDKGEKESTKVSAILNIDLDMTVQHSFLNGIYLPENGTIHDGILTGLRNCLNKFCKEKALFDKKEKQISVKDIEDVISYAAIVDSDHVSYENQVKFKTKKNTYKTVTQKYIEEFFEIYKVTNKDDFEKMCLRVLTSKRASEKAENTRKSIKKDLESKITSSIDRPEKLVPCRTNQWDSIEFILLEGDSALNSIKLGRNPIFQAILPLKGKPINVIKNELQAVLQNKEVRDIYKILGCGMEYKGKQIKGIPNFNIGDLKVGKILITTDCDEDGLHIQALLIAMFFTLSPQLIEKGIVHIVYCPLYVIKTNKKVEFNGELTDELFAYSEEDKNDKVRELTQQGIKVKTTRYKGLGGLNVSVMSKSLNPKTRYIKQVTMGDIEEAREYINMFMSKEGLEDRKKFIIENGKDYFDYSIYE